MKKTVKKALCMLIIASMILSVSFAFALSASAVDGMWNVFGTATEYDEGFGGTPVSRPGYEYTDEGLHMIPAKWEGHQTPFGTFQTKNKIDLKEGVYMLVRVDNFTYSGEKWFNFSIWDSVGIAPGSQGYGEGAQCHIRPGDKKNVGGVDWYTGGFTNVGTTIIPKTSVSLDDEGRVILALTISWDGSSYTVDVNGAPAHENVIAYMNEKWGGNDSEAYIGFSLQNSNKNGTVEATILKFGTSKATATTPKGDDRRAPEEFNHTPAELGNASDIPAGQPAVFMNGNIIESDIMTSPISLVGANITTNADYSVHISVNKEKADSGQWTVKYNVSYSADDFPVCAILTKNLCTCRDEVCYGKETCHLYICTGEEIQPAPQNLVEYLDIATPITVGEDTYLLFYIDMSDEYAPFDATGRINSARVDFTDIDYQTPGMNEFDVCYIAFFRNVDEAQSYTYNYLGVSDVEKPIDPDENDTDDETDVNIESKPGNNDDPAQSESESEENGADTPTASSGGCGSAIGSGVIVAIVAITSGCLILIKKKKD